MKKMCVYLILLFTVLNSMHAQEQQQDANFFQNQYRKLCDDFVLIKNQYITKSASSEEEKQAAKDAIIRRGAEVAGVAIVATAGIIGGVCLIKKMCKKNKPNDPSLDQDNDQSALLTTVQEYYSEAIGASIENNVLTITLPDWYHNQIQTRTDTGRLCGEIAQKTNAGRVHWNPVKSTNKKKK